MDKREGWVFETELADIQEEGAKLSGAEQDALATRRIVLQGMAATVGIALFASLFSSEDTASPGSVDAGIRALSIEELTAKLLYVAEAVADIKEELLQRDFAGGAPGGRVKTVLENYQAVDVFKAIEIKISDNGAKTTVREASKEVVEKLLSLTEYFDVQTTSTGGSWQPTPAELDYTDKALESVAKDFSRMIGAIPLAVVEEARRQNAGD